MAKETKQDYLEKLREKSERLANRSSSGGQFWYPEDGTETRIRVLPPVGEMEFFFQEVGRYRFNDNTTFYSADFTTEGQVRCPVRDLVWQLYKGGDEDKALWEKLKGWPVYRESYYMNVVVRDNEDDDVGGIGKPMIFAAPYTVWVKMINLINMNQYGDISDEYEGTDVIVKRSKSGNKVDYDIFPMRKSTPLFPKEEDIDSTLEAAEDLSWVMLSEDPAEDDKLGEGHRIRLMPYDRVVEEIGLSPQSSPQEIMEILNRKPAQDGGGSKSTATPSQVKAALRESSTPKEEEAFPVEEPAKEAEDDVGKEITTHRKQRRMRSRTR